LAAGLAELAELKSRTIKRRERGGAMAEIVQMSGKKTRGRPRKKKLEGYGADLLRMAGERRVAESSEDLADLLLSKAMEGKLESVKMLMKFAEEEKARKEEERRESEPSLFEKLGLETLEPEIGDVWEGKGWRNPETGVFVKGSWEGTNFDVWKDDWKDGKKAA
jgi:hypothetical protein